MGKSRIRGSLKLRIMKKLYVNSLVHKLVNIRGV